MSFQDIYLDEELSTASNIDEAEDKIALRNILKKQSETWGRPANTDWTEELNTFPNELREEMKNGTVKTLEEYIKDKPEHLKHCALQYAIEDNQNEIIKFLIRNLDKSILLHKYDVFIDEGITEKSLLQYFTELNNEEMAKCFLSRFPPYLRQKIILEEIIINFPGKLSRIITCYHLAAYLGLTELTHFYISGEIGIQIDFKTQTGETALMWAARGNKTSLIETLIRSEAKPSLKNINGCTALRWAVRYGHAKSVDVLLKYFTNEHKPDLISSFNLASALGYSQIVKSIINSGLIDVNTPDSGQQYPIHLAAKEGHEDILRILFENKADLNKTDAKKNTALFLAIQNDQIHAARLLIKFGCDVFHKNLEDEDIWSHARLNKNNACLTGLIYSLMEKFKEGNIKMKIFFTTQSPVFEFAKNGDLEKLKFLSTLKLNMKTKDENNNTILHLAAQGKHQAIINYFSDPNCINEQNISGETGLHLAASTGCYETVNTFITLGAKANIKNRVGEAVLHIAAKSKNTSTEVMRYLIIYVMNRHSWDSLNDTDNKGRNALHVAALYNSPDVIWECRILTSNRSDTNGDTPYHLAIRPGQPNIFHKMLDIYDFKLDKLDLNQRNNKGETVVFKVVQNHLSCCFKRLLQYDIDLTIPYKNNDTVLHLIVKACIADRDNLKMIDAFIDYVVSNKNFKLFRKLILELENEENFTVYSLAFSELAKEIVEKLMTIKDITQFEEGGQTYFDVTQIMNNNLYSRNGNIHRLILNMKTTNSLQDLLTIAPLIIIRKMYEQMNITLCCVAMVIHLAHMIVLSYVACECINYKRVEAENTTSNISVEMHIKILSSLIEPILVLILCLISFYHSTRRCYIQKEVKLYKRLCCKHILKFILIGYAAFSITWIFLFYTNEPRYYIILGIALCYGWLFSIIFIRGIKTFHYFWRVMQNIFKRDIKRFMVMYLFVLIAFSHLFQIWLTGSNFFQEDNPIPTMFTMFYLIIGMEEIFDYTLKDGLNKASNLSVLYKCAYCLYVILGAIILLNVLVAMMNDSYVDIKQNNEIYWEIESFKQAIRMEKLCPKIAGFFKKEYIVKRKEGNSIRYYTIKQLEDITN